uniref:Venom S1 protease 12 n=1 Tax=Lethocerus distinctifemur TaxID=280095 RepID=A0A2K8JL15_9HEMI|nr:venom S1 protease 12 [Lethocerus distinctifemur]
MMGGLKWRCALLGCMWLVVEISSLLPNSAYWAQPEWIEEIDSSEEGQSLGQKTTTCPCGWTNKDDGRIVGGRETKINEFPHMAGLAFENETAGQLSLFCGATILTPYHVLTAAHCTERRDPKSIYVIVGDHDLLSVTETKHTNIYRAGRVVSHENYDGMNFYHDIALIVLQKKMAFNQAVGPACLPKEPRPMLNEYVKVTGWGNTKYKGSMSNVLLKVNLRVVPIQDCSDRYWQTPVNVTDPKQFCTYGLGKDACQGDSGGPLVWLDPETNRFTHVGIVSYGWACAKSSPGVNTDVHAYLNWVNANIKRTSPEKVQVCTRKD